MKEIKDSVVGRGGWQRWDCGEFSHMSILNKGLGSSWKILDVQEDVLKTYKEFELFSIVFLVFINVCVCVCVRTCICVHMYISYGKDVHKRKKKSPTRRMVKKFISSDKILCDHLNDFIKDLKQHDKNTCVKKINKVMWVRM